MESASRRSCDRELQRSLLLALRHVDSEGVALVQLCELQHLSSVVTCLLRSMPVASTRQEQLCWSAQTSPETGMM